MIPLNAPVIANIKVPALTSNYVCRVSLPNNEGTSKTKRHIDYPSHRGSKNALTVWLPLQDTDKKNGSLKIYPGSRKVKTYSGDGLVSTEFYSYKTKWDGNNEALYEDFPLSLGSNQSIEEIDANDY